jgi:DNA-binding beta-propeller fold protein YncE
VVELSATDPTVGVSILSASDDEIDAPDAIFSDGTHVWVANSGGGSTNFNGTATELSASSGTVVRDIHGPKFAFEEPDAISSNGTDVWVVSPDNHSVAELSTSNGALVKKISGSSYGFSDPDGVSSVGSTVWVANSGNNSVTELSATNGALVEDIHGSATISMARTRCPPTEPMCGSQTLRRTA